MDTRRVTLFDSPLFLGFDHFEKTFDRVRKMSNEGYPPYNIEQTDDNGLRITLAVAGFSMNDLDIEIDNTQLIIRGKQIDDDEKIYLHRGIASRQFQRNFILADGIEVRGASLDNGLLHIALKRVIPESQARKVNIEDLSAKIKTPQAIDVEETKKRK